MTIDTFDHVAGWGTSDNIVPDDFNGLEKWFTGEGFEEFDDLGYPDIIGGIRIYERKGSFLASIDTCLQWRLIYCPNLPSCFGLLAQLEPWFRMMQGTELAEIAREFRELLIEHGADGPLGECLLRRKRREEYYREQREKARAAK